MIALKSGAMDVKPILMTENTVGPTLGSDSISSGLNACILGGLLVLAFMIFYYKSLGVIANIALIINLLLLVGAMAFFRGTLTLPGIAGFALTIGMAVDATVLIFERLREESSKKQAFKASLVKGYEKAFVTIFDSNFTTFITALILYVIGNSGPVKGFCLSLMLGLGINLFAAVFVTQTILSWAVFKNKLSAFKMNKKLISNDDIDFISKGPKIRMISLSILVLGIAAIGYRVSTNNFLDIDFTGGNLIQVNLAEKATAGEIRKISEEAGYPNAMVQEFGGSEGLSFTIRTKELSKEEIVNFKKVLNEKFKLPEHTAETIDIAFPRDIKVGGAAATSMFANAFIALIVAMLAILFYIMMRFSEFKYGLAACLALFHDLLITIGVLAIFGVQINLTIFAAILTVIGYSLNDTIVIFDRIRENVGIQKTPDMEKIARKSLNHTLNRTLLTSITTFFVISSLIILGGGIIKGFAYTMLIGLITGTYSSLFIAVPFVLRFYNKNNNGEIKVDSVREITAHPAGTV